MLFDVLDAGTNERRGSFVVDERGLILQFELSGVDQPLTPLPGMTGGITDNGVLLDGIEMLAPSDPAYLSAIVSHLVRQSLLVRRSAPSPGVTARLAGAPETAPA